MRRAWSFAAVLLALAAVLTTAAWRLSRPSGAAEVRATLSAAATLASGDTAGFARVDGSRPVRLPEDHAAHPEFRNEWWYVTGNLEAQDGRRFGYQITLFRNALAPTAPAGGSAWTTNQAWMAHLALTDPQGGRFAHAERVTRGALGLAGAEGEPLRVWVEDWEIEGGEDGAFPVRIRAGEPDFGVDLELEALRAPVLHGRAGYHVKDPETGSASHYYSLTRLRTGGVVRTGGEVLEVEGLSWMDREWSTTGLPEGVAGWDWMGLQLSDGRDLMVYRLRAAGGAEEVVASGGTLVETDGRARPLDGSEVSLEPLAWWPSPMDGARWPTAWRVTVPSAGLDLEIRAVREDQELRLSFRYWEGAVDVRGPPGAGAIGRGYLETTGYDAAGADDEPMRGRARTGALPPQEAERWPPS